MRSLNNIKEFLRRQPRWRYVVVLAALAAAAYFLTASAKPRAKGTTFVARRGPLDITVVEGGSAQAQESQEIKCEVRVGYQGIKVLKIVEEGYQVTDEDIKTNKVLVELDSSDLRKQITQQDITFESTAASLVNAQQAYDIQVNQNTSDVKAAEQKLKFARMDLDKFLGVDSARDVLNQVGPLEAPPSSQTNAVDAPSGPLAALPGGADPAASSALTNLLATPTNATVLLASAQPATGLQIQSDVEKPLLGTPVPPPQADPASIAKTDQVRRELRASVVEPPKLTIDFFKYADEAKLGDGEAKQKIRKFKDDFQMAQKEQGQAKTTLEGTLRLFEKQFAPRTEKERDEISWENTKLKVQTAETALDLFLRYDFVKSAEEFLSKYLEAARELDRARKAAVSKLVQAEAQLKSSEGRYNLESRQRKELYEQLEKCVVKAQKPGLVVYGGGGDEMYWRGEEQIREGATVRERQAIITIPDMTKMSVKVKIHETYIKKVKKGQKARITVDAFADKVLQGEVSKVGVLPDSQNRWMNPDLKVYLTTISIEGVHDWLKPGMTAKVEIFVNRLADVVHVPIQAVTPRDGKQYLFVAHAGGREQREIEVGEFNDEFIEVKKGLKEGERIYLRGPEAAQPESRGTRQPSPAEGQPGKAGADKPTVKPAGKPNPPSPTAKS